MADAHTPRWPVLLMCRELGPGGSERQLTQLALHLDPSRFQVHVGTFRPGGIRRAELEAGGIPIVEVPVRSFGSPAFLGVAHRFRRYLRQHAIQIVHTFDAPASLFAVPLARTARVPVVLSSQRSHRTLVLGWPGRLLEVIDRLVDGVVVNSRAMQQHMADEGMPEDRILLVHNGLDTARFRPERRVNPTHTCVIGTVCVLRPEKDLGTLIRAFARARAAGADVKLVIVGSGPEREALETLVADSTVGEHVQFAGDTADVTGWLHGMDIFVLPSRSEAFSNALMEAMACGCCCVATAVGGNPELVEDGISGRLFEPGRTDQLTAILADLVARPEARLALGREGARLVADRFAIEAQARILAERYETALRHKGARAPRAEHPAGTR